LLSLSFPNAGLMPLVFVALVPLLVWIQRDSAGPASASAPRAGRGNGWVPWLAGAVFNMLLFWWLVRLPARAMTHPWIIVPALLALGLYLGFFFALFGWITRFIRRRVGWSPLAVAPAVWGVSEWLKASGPLGCPWGNVSYALAEHPAWIQGASLVGAPGLSIWIVCVNALFAGAIVARRWPARAALAALGIALVALPVAWGKDRVRSHRPGETIRVALVQPNIASDEKWDAAHQEKSIRTLSRLSREASEQVPKPDLLVWPETALPFYVRLEAAKLARIFDLIEELNIPLLVGYPDATLSMSGGVITHNAAGLVLPSGTIAAQYEKIHLVPFGERIPFQGVLPFLGKIDLGQAEWTPGIKPVIFPLAKAPFGVLICFESIFPGLARDNAMEGARLLVNITNDEWFGPTAAPRQHADMAILRCVEQQMGMARCANTGISMIIDPMGRVTQESPLFREALLSGDVELGGAPTTFRLWGDWVTGLCLGLVLVLMLLGWYRPLRRDR
jgi:apolipoprotein N-acyltransferase